MIQSGPGDIADVGYVAASGYVRLKCMWDLAGVLGIRCIGYTCLPGVVGSTVWGYIVCAVSRGLYIRPNVCWGII